jgi:hypothetical protein
MGNQTEFLKPSKSDNFRPILPLFFIEDLPYAPCSLLFALSPYCSLIHSAKSVQDTIGEHPEDSPLPM